MPPTKQAAMGVSDEDSCVSARSAGCRGSDGCWSAGSGCITAGAVRRRDLGCGHYARVSDSAEWISESKSGIAGARQQIWARGLAVGTTDEDTVVVITVDTLGIPDDLHERVAAKLQQHGIARDRLAICASHTHSGPMIRNCANTLFGQPIPEDQWQTILKYTDELEAKLVQVAIEALADRKPAKLSWGIGKVGFAFNRRTPGGPVDHDLPLLAVHDPDGRLRAVFTNYACHCVTLSDDMISGDWAGYAMEHIQRRNPGCQALISIGCGADSNPRAACWARSSMSPTVWDTNLPKKCSVCFRPTYDRSPKHRSALMERVTLKLAELPTREQWEELAKNQNAIGYHARTQLARLDRGESLMSEISYPDSDHFIRRRIGVGLPAGRSCCRLCTATEAGPGRQSRLGQCVCQCVSRLCSIRAHSA